MVNSIRKEDVQDYSPFDDGEGCQFVIFQNLISLLDLLIHLLVSDRSRFWLFLAYVFAFMSLAGAAAFLVMDNQPSSLISTWVGTAGVLQSMFILGRSEPQFKCDSFKFWNFNLNMVLL